MWQARPARLNTIATPDVGPPVVSILIVNFNGAAFLPACLNSLRTVHHPAFEILVVDNASTDASLELLRSYPEVRVVRSDMNLGFAGGNNFGLPFCRAPLVLLLNSDTLVTPGFLEPLVEYLRAHPEVGIVQGKMVLTRHANGLDVCGSFLTCLGVMYHYGYYKPDAPKYDRSGPVFTGKGACFLFRKDVVAKAGGYLFNQDFFCYYEETDFCHRAWLAGVETHFVAASKIEHLQGATSETTQRAGWALKQFLTNQTFGLLANLSTASLFRIMPFYFALFAVALAASLVTGRWTIFAAHWHALVQNAKNLKKIRAQRSMVRQIRKLSDADLFAKVMKTPRWDYFWKTFRGRVADYVDEDLRPSGGL